MTTTGRKQIGFLLAAVAIAMAAFLLFLWKGAFLPREIYWEEDDLSWEDLAATLKDRTFSLYQDDRKIWSSEWDWNVQACEIADLDGDGIEELLLLVWKRGSYGDHMPFWVKRNDHDLEQHICRDIKAEYDMKIGNIEYEIMSYNLEIEKLKLMIDFIQAAINCGEHITEEAAAKKAEDILQNYYDDLEKLVKLKEKGVLTEEEFNKLRSDLVAKL